MQGTLLEVECDDPARAEELLHEVAGVSNVSQHGLILHVTCITPAVKNEISRVLSLQGIIVHRIEQVIPSLEDAFITMVEEEDQSRH
jgi:ABC-type uncharacterized transport system ATPase subunit